MQMDKRKLESVFYLTVNDITFGSDAIGAAAPNGRAATSTWTAGDTVVFKGKLKHILSFALMAFDVASVAISELFTLTPERRFLNMPSPDDVAIIDLDPAQGEGIITDDDMTFMQNLTNNFRLNWGDYFNVVAEKVADSTRSLYYASVIELLAYGLQFEDQGTAEIYTLYDFALQDAGGSMNRGVTYLDIDGSQGPIELEKAHVTLANIVLGVSAV